MQHRHILALSSSWSVVLALPAVLLLPGCSGDDEEEPAPTTGRLEIVGGWSGELPDGARPSAALFDCPFVMPPRTTAGGTISGNLATITAEELTPGPLCVLAFLDADRSDGVMPVNGLDFVAYPPVGQESFPVTITAGQTTRLEVTYELRPVEPPDPDGTPGPEEVWIKLHVECARCDATSPLIFYGYQGEELGTIPQLYNSFTEELIFPFEVAIKKSGAIQIGPLPAGRHIVVAYQNSNRTGMKPDEGEPASAPQIVDLVAGEWNRIELKLE